MREINNRFKFKAFHHDSNEMIEDGKLGDVFRWLNDGQDISILQYTGLKDKNGVEAYEGDICVNDSGKVATIEYFEQGACFDFIALNQIGDAQGYSAQMFKYKTMVVGNIHENPELLESNND